MNGKIPAFVELNSNVVTGPAVCGAGFTEILSGAVLIWIAQEQGPGKITNKKHMNLDLLPILSNPHKHQFKRHSARQPL
ncbi:MAG: hypothetical protein AB7N80_11555 [Bdellovibrionales bacterium]